MSEGKIKPNPTDRKTSILDLPFDVLLDIFLWLRPSEIRTISHGSLALEEYLSRYDYYLAKRIIAERYNILSKCFPLPISVTELDSRTKELLGHPEILHRSQTQHPILGYLEPGDLSKICSCKSCKLAWDNLCLVVDLAHFQGHLHYGVPIPKLGPAGDKNNTKLMKSVALQVEEAVRSPMAYAAILELQLFSIVSTITRTHMSAPDRKRYNNLPGFRPRMRPLYLRRPYGLTDEEVALNTDHFLRRQYKEAQPFPKKRDDYYGLEPYLPNRSWIEEDWAYGWDGHKCEMAFYFFHHGDEAEQDDELECPAMRREDGTPLPLIYSDHVSNPGFG